jgi:hypothetical protein
MEVRLNWIADYPHKDYTVSVYSKLSANIKDASGATRKIHMDGQVPSGFTASSYCGPYCPTSTTGTVAEDTRGPFSKAFDYKGPAEESQSLLNLIQSADNIFVFFRVIRNKPILLIVWVRFW